MAAPEAPPLDQAHVQRIIGHMNADHQDDLSWYLQHYNNVPEDAAKTAVLDNLSLQGLTISTANGKPHFVPFQPPLATLGDTRGRLVEMTNVSLAALKLARVEVKRFPGWTPVGYAMGLLTLYGASVFWNPDAWLQPGTITREYCLMNQGFLVDLVREWHWWGFVGLWGAHVVETAVLMEKLERYRVKRFGATWWKYVGSCLAVGFDTFTVLNREVEREMENSVKRK